MTGTRSQSMSAAQYNIAIRDHLHGGICRYSAPGVSLLETDICDLTIHIGAPESAVSGSEGMQIYLDSAGSPCRHLPERSWQIHCEDSVGAEAFRAWARELAQLMIKPLLETGLCCVDLADLQTLLSQAKGRRIVAWQGDWSSLDKLADKLVNEAVEHAWVAVFANPDKLSVELFSMTGIMMEERLPDDAMLLVTANLQREDVSRVMVLGVLAAGT